MSIIFLWLQYGVPATIGKVIVWAIAKSRKVKIFWWEISVLIIPFVFWYGLMMISHRGWWRFFSYLPYAGILVAIFAWIRLVLPKRLSYAQSAWASLGIDCAVIFLFWFFWPCMLNEECK